MSLFCLSYSAMLVACLLLRTTRCASTDRLPGGFCVFQVLAVLTMTSGMLDDWEPGVIEHSDPHSKPEATTKTLKKSKPHIPRKLRRVLTPIGSLQIDQAAREVDANEAQGGEAGPRRIDAKSEEDPGWATSIAQTAPGGTQPA